MDRHAAWILGILLAFGVFGLPAAADESETGGGDTIAWLHDLPQAFEAAASQNKVLLICVNTKNPIGEPDEPAAKGLREVVYKDPKVVEKARTFVCVLVSAGGSSADFGELRVRLGIDGLIVSPQHIFLHPKHEDGAKPLVREQYWRYGDGPEAVEALIALMDKALTVYQVNEGVPELPTSPEGRAAWIKQLIDLVKGPDAGLRKQALGELVLNDEQGDCTTPLIPLVAELDSAGNAEGLADVVRTLGIPGLEAAAAPIHEVLSHKNADVRGNAAVTLEYIGCAASVEPLLARAKREKDEKIANHIWRAVGRCADGDEGARKKLLRAAAPGKKSDFASFGPVIALAHFEGDAKAARSLEKQMLKLGSPIQTGIDKHTFLRAATAWCLSEIRDPKTAKFVRKKILAPLEDVESHWKASVVQYYDAIARKCEGADDVQPLIDRGISAAIWSNDARELVDVYRVGRDMSKIVPKGEWGNMPRDD